MPPKRASKRGAPPTAAPPLSGCQIAVSGTFPGMTQAAVKSLIEKLGGTPVNSIGPATSHLITTQADFDKPSGKVTTAQSHNAHTVSLQWLQECLSAKSRVQENPHSFGSSSAPDPTANPTVSSVKREASSAGIDELSEEERPSKKAKANGKVPPGDEATGKGPKDTSKPKSREIQVPVDECCPLLAYAVYIDADGIIWDASLNQSNSSNNNNKFYRVQLLHNGAGDYKTWTRWGRVGVSGQTAMLGNGSLDDAKRKFEAKFRDKSGLRWDDRNESPVPGKYAFIERSYDMESGDEDAAADSRGDKETAEDWTPPACTLELPVQKLMELIFNQQYFAAAMTELNYDANKLPLGKLSKSVITRGFQALKDLAALLDNSALAESLYNTTPAAATEMLSNLYYTLIPHAFGFARPPIIRDYGLLKKEIELLESLGDMKDAELIMKVDRAKAETLHPLDRQFAGLGMREMTPLDSGGSEYLELTKYLIETCGATHNTQYAVESIFRIERSGETDRFNNSTFAGPPRDRRLLWHGSRVTNFGGILSQGLRIAPPEAPVSGYMFGKGIYLADMSSKSANYCCSYISGGTALLLLCEAELGDPLQELVHASYTAGEDAKSKGMLSTWGQGRTGPTSWRDASCVHPDLSGVKIPNLSKKPGSTNVANASLLYNEYIVYDVAQVRLRYLFRVKMG